MTFLYILNKHVRDGYFLWHFIVDVKILLGSCLLLPLYNVPGGVRHEIRPIRGRYSTIASLKEGESSLCQELRILSV